MKKVKLNASAPQVVTAIDEGGVPLTLSRAAGTDFVFKVSDVAYLNGQPYFDISENVTDDRFDFFAGTLDFTSDANAIDAYKWYRAPFCKGRREIQITSDQDIWVTFEDPYVVTFAQADADTTYPRDPVKFDPGSPTSMKPYRTGADFSLISQPVDAAGDQYTYPKCFKIKQSSGVYTTIRFSIMGLFASDIWLRPISDNDPEIVIYAY